MRTLSLVRTTLLCPELLIFHFSHGLPTHLTLFCAIPLAMPHFRNAPFDLQQPM